MTITATSSDISLSRVTGTLLSSLTMSTISSSTARILELQSQISSGYTINRPSDNPIGANRVLQLQAMMAANDRYAANIQTVDQTLSSAESAMMEMQDLLNSAKTIMLREVGSSGTTDTRQNSAIEIENLLAQAVSSANQKFGNTYLFGGSASANAPFTLLTDSVLYNGDDEVNRIRIAGGMTAAANITGSEAFGALSASISSDVDLNPDITTGTFLKDLNGGEGVFAGSITVDNGVTTTTIDIGGAETIGDVIDMINNDTVGIVTAAINSAGNGLTLTTATGNIGVTEYEGGTTARDLGVFRATAAAGPLVGSDLDPLLTAATSVGALRGGLGLSSLTADIAITNGADTATIDFTGAATVQDILNAFNQSGVNVVASINAAGDGLKIVSRANGARLSIDDVGSGASADQLGLLMTIDRVRLCDLNGGTGVNTVTGTDLAITRSDGVVVSVDISGAETVGDVIDLINNDPENTNSRLVASLDVANNRLSLRDNSGGTGDLIVANDNGSYAAADLGIEGTSPYTGSAIIRTGATLNPAGVRSDNIFTALIALRDALYADDTTAIGNAGKLIETAQQTILNAVADVGARVQRLDTTTNRLEDEQVNLEKALSEVRDVDYAAAITDLEYAQTVFQAGLSVASILLQNSLLNYL